MNGDRRSHVDGEHRSRERGFVIEFIVEKKSTGEENRGRDERGDRS